MRLQPFGSGSGLPLEGPLLNAAAARCLYNAESVGHRLLHERNVRDQADCSTLTNDVLQNLQDLIQRPTVAVAVKAAESLVDKDCVETDRAMRHLHDI